MEYQDLKAFIFNYADETDPTTSFIEKLIIMLQKQRNDVNSQVYSFAHRLQHINGLLLLQSELFNLRQKLLEDNHLILDKINILNTKLHTIKGTAVEELNKSHQVRYQSADERNQVVLGQEQVRTIVQQIETLTNHTIFLKDTMTKLDDMKFAIRNTIDINSLLGSVPGNKY